MVLPLVMLKSLAHSHQLAIKGILAILAILAILTIMAIPGIVIGRRDSAHSLPSPPVYIVLVHPAPPQLLPGAVVCLTRISERTRLAGEDKRNGPGGGRQSCEGGATPPCQDPTLPPPPVWRSE